MKKVNSKTLLSITHVHQHCPSTSNQTKHTIIPVRSRHHVSRAASRAVCLALAWFSTTACVMIQSHTSNTSVTLQMGAGRLLSCSSSRSSSSRAPLHCLNGDGRSEVTLSRNISSLPHSVMCNYANVAVCQTQSGAHGSCRPFRIAASPDSHVVQVACACFHFAFAFPWMVAVVQDAWLATVTWVMEHLPNRPQSL